MNYPAVFPILAFLIPAAALWLAAPAERSAHGLAVSPFGWPSLLIVHCLAAIPLAAAAGRWVVRQGKVLTPWPAVGIGVVLASGAYILMGLIGELLDTAPADFTTRSILRSLICTMLALPWFVAAYAGSQQPAGTWGTIAIGLLTALVLPAVWSDTLARERVTTVQDELAARRMTRASRVVDGLCDLDPFRTGWVNGPKHLVAYRDELRQTQKKLSDRVASTHFDSLNPTEQLNYANDLLSLDRLAEAETVLRTLIRTVPPANLPLARVLHLLGRYDESDAAARELLAAGLPVLTSKPSIRKACLDAYDLMAENATRRGSNAEREAILKEMLTTIPDEEASIRFQLGRHYQVTGRPAAAVSEFNEAVRLNKAFEPSAALMIREMRQLTPACLIGR